MAFRPHKSEEQEARRITQPLKIEGTRNKRRYTIKQWLDDGSFADIFWAKDNQYNRDVAIKIAKVSFESNLSSLFQKEAPFLLTHNHPHIIQVYDVPTICERAIMIMELAEENLAAHISRRTFNTLDDVFEIIRPVCEAVDFIHQQKDEKGENLVHRDVKPKNVLITAQGIIKVADLGSVGARGDTSTVHGTDGFRAIEGFDVESRSEFHPESDVYSLGVLTYYLFFKSTPYIESGWYDAKKDENFVREQCNKNKLDSSLTEVIAKATHPDYKKRFHSPLEFCSALMSLRGSTSVNVNGSSIKRTINELYKTLEESLNLPSGKLGIAADTAAEKQYVAFSNLEAYVKANGLEDDPLFAKGQEKYDAAIDSDISAVTKWINNVGELRSAGSKEVKEFVDYLKAIKEGRPVSKTRPRLETEYYEILKIVHMRWRAKPYDNGKRTISADDTRCSLGQVRDGTFRRHYEGGLERGDGLFSR